MMALTLSFADLVFIGSTQASKRFIGSNEFNNITILDSSCAQVFSSTDKIKTRECEITSVIDEV